MSNQPKPLSRGFLGRAFAVFGAAINVSNAIENRSRPSVRDLSTLGLDPKAFDRS